MFQKAKNIDEAFRQVRRFSFYVVVICAALTSFILYRSLKVMEEARTRIYVLINGKIFKASEENQSDNVEIEARDHVSTFHELLFTLEPDETFIQKQVSKALYLADGSAQKFYENLKETGYYASMISGNTSQQMTVDSIRIQLSGESPRFDCFAHQKITRPASITIRSFHSAGILRRIHRSDHNPHGFLIENWKVLENQDEKTTNRFQ